MSIRILFSQDDNDKRKLSFVEVENEKRESVDLGEWVTDENGYRVLEVDEEKLKGIDLKLLETVLLYSIQTGMFIDPTFEKSGITIEKMQETLEKVRKM